ncbi:MAG: hypothetical protein ACREXT_11300 [Gammaproteobacteria bacterium]
MTLEQYALAMALMFVHAVVGADEYPTLDRVDHVLTCMKQNGGQNIDNLWRCSCEIDVIAQQLSLEDFNTARTYEIYKNMPGEKGGLFRESTDGSTATEKLEAARHDAAKRCFVGATRQTVIPTDQGMPEKPTENEAQ